ncbi:hypothetical protein WJX84_008737 [Apatococcus fuscideae]|uniref:Uncharacterized protein n=1 Tax=Apatococcus fuscideae TaxID=2026836 RepID=A0AAW1T3D8_9CHLO
MMGTTRVQSRALVSSTSYGTKNPLAIQGPTADLRLATQTVLRLFLTRNFANCTGPCAGCKALALDPHVKYETLIAESDPLDRVRLQTGSSNCLLQFPRLR